MQTPRPDHFTYPPHGALPAETPAVVQKKPWVSAAFVAGLIGAFALGLALTY